MSQSDTTCPLPSGDSSRQSRAWLVCWVLTSVPWLDGNSCDLLSGFCLMGWPPLGSFPSPRKNPGELGFSRHELGKLGWRFSWR